jgi:hypothetical protein
VKEARDGGDDVYVPADGGEIADAGCTEIQAANYDQSCATDNDCTDIPVGNVCSCEFQCGRVLGVVGVAGLNQYLAEYDKTQAAIAKAAGDAANVCSCSEIPVPRPPSCCRSGQCHLGSECSSVEAGVECTSSAECMSGRVCCADMSTSTTCRAGPCPDVAPGSPPIQLCATSTECFTAGDTCGTYLPGISTCRPPADEGGLDAGDDVAESGGDVGTWDAPAGG